MARYDIFKKLDEFITTYCKMEKTGEYQYNKMIRSGELSKTHYDYGRGYYDVCIYYILSQNKHCCRIWFGTIDDGEFGSWTECNSKEKAIELVEKAKDIFSEIDVCPSYEELNLLFRDLGVYFCHE